MKQSRSEAARWSAGPSANVAEVNVFGPGQGESVVVHIGGGRWIVVDSCRDPDTGRPAALDYLDAIGAEVAADVMLVVATHWHDDHIVGLSTIFERALQATFVYPAALKTAEFLQIVEAYGRRAMMERPGAVEFEGILSIAQARKRERGTLPMNAVKAHTILWREDASRIEALSPSEAAFERGLVEIRGSLASEGAKVRLRSRSPNENSIVVLVAVGGAEVLLGGDLQETGTAVRGWTTILDSPLRPTERPKLFKPAHHGADNGDHPRIWSELLRPDAKAALTSYRGGKKPRPTLDDQRRLVAAAKGVYLTSSPVGMRSQGRDATTERLLRARHEPVRLAEGPLGHVRLRRELDGGPDDDWEVELFGGARQLH